MKEKKMKKERFWDTVAMVLYLLADVMFIASFFIKEKAIWISILAFGWMLYIMAGAAKDISHTYAIMYLKEDIMQLSNACIFILDNQQEIYDYINDEEEVPEEETKETVIVNPEDFERFSRGEMTKEELLGIKKAVDKVTKAKTKAL